MSSARITSGAALPAGLPFALAACSGDLCLISGMPALDVDGKYQPGTIREQLDGAWATVIRIAEEAGYCADEIMFVHCVLGDIDDYAALNAWWEAQFPDTAASPARFTFQTGALPFGCKVELQATAGRA